MRAAKVFGQEKERIARSGLGLSVVYLLSQGNIPSEMREEIVRQSESGTPISFKEAKKIQKKYKQKPENQLITQTPSTTSNQLTTKLETTKTNSRPIPTRANKHNHKQEIIQIITQSTAKIPTRELAKNYWQLNQHLLFCGYPLEEEFIVKLPERVALTLAFPPFPDWSREALLPVRSNSTSVFQSEFTDVDPALLSSTVRQTIELYTEGGDDVIVSFLPDFDILQLIDFLGCRCLIAEPDLQRCQKILAKFEQWE